MERTGIGRELPPSLASLSATKFSLQIYMELTALPCVRFYPGVTGRAELVTLASGVCPERRFAPLARGYFQLSTIF